jgi:pimeloyl-ACP methyl ester carboxylesterase
VQRSANSIYARLDGLGALPDAPDERDHPLTALYASEGLTASVVVPASDAAPAMPPGLDQHATPMCVAYSSGATKAWQDRRDQGCPSLVIHGRADAIAPVA